MSEYKEIKGFMDGLRPEEILLVSEWADKHRWIAPGASPEPGLWKTSRFPFLKKIMDVLSSHSTYREVFWKKSAQTGATELGMNWLGYCIDNSPAATLLVMPTEAMAKKASRTRLEPMIRATPRLSKKMNRKGSTNTILEKDFPGGTLSLVGANAPSGLRSMPIKNLMMDEVDAYPLDLGGEGSPTSLARARTNLYKRHKIYIPSTPTVEGISQIDAEYQDTDKQKFFVPCPHCATQQTFEWENMMWKGKEDSKSHVVHSPPTAHYVCPHCKEPIFERHKRDMLAAGEWIATDPEKSNPLTIGFHINAMYSPIYTWERMVTSFLKAGNDLNKLNTFTNVGLGECSKPLTDAPKWQDIQKKAVERQRNQVPQQVKFITVGVDVQLDRLELSVVGWGHDKRRWLIDYRVLPGNVYTKEPWDQLRPVIREFWKRDDGMEFPVAKMCIDAGSYSTQVYTFIGSLTDKRQVQAIKGADNMAQVIGSPVAVNKNAAGKGISGVMLTMVGSSFLKTELYGYLKLDKAPEDEDGPAGYIHLLRLEDRYFKGLVSEEERAKKDKKGRNVYEWFVIYERNEPLDTMNYARAAAAMFGIDRFDNDWMDAISEGYQKKTPDPIKSKPTEDLSNIEGGFWGNYD